MPNFYRYCIRDIMILDYLEEQRQVSLLSCSGFLDSVTRCLSPTLNRSKPWEVQRRGMVRHAQGGDILVDFLRAKESWGFEVTGAGGTKYGGGMNGSNETGAHEVDYLGA